MTTRMATYVSAIAEAVKGAQECLDLYAENKKGVTELLII